MTVSRGESKETEVSDLRSRLVSEMAKVRKEAEKIKRKADKSKRQRTIEKHMEAFESHNMLYEELLQKSLAITPLGEGEGTRGGASQSNGLVYSLSPLRKHMLYAQDLYDPACEEQKSRKRLRVAAKVYSSQ
jgi:hypothetical protein